MFPRLLSFFLFFLSIISTSSCASQFSQRADVQEFIHGMVVKHHFSEVWLDGVFDQVHPNKQVLTLISKPAEKKPWYFYRNIFITDRRVREGVIFYQKNQRTLQKAEQTYGVPASIIASIIGVETSYGNGQGNIRTIDALSTLAFDYPPRSSYFRKELEQFLLLTREQSWNPVVLHGSYAGALGYPQFMPSSYRKYAVDFNQNRHVDLFTSPSDAIGSVGNYLKMNGWRTNEPIAVKARLEGQHYQSLGDKVSPKTLKEWASYGIYANSNYPLDKKAGLIRLEGGNGSEYWLIFRNFYVIMSYNNSSLYAMSVYQLSQLLERQRKE